MGSQSNDLARAAINAVTKLAATAGHPIKSVPAAGPGDASNGPPVQGLIIVALAAVAAAGAIIALRRRQPPR